MMIARQMVKAVAAGLLVVGLSTPAFASGTLTNKFTDVNTVNVDTLANSMDYGMATTIGNYDSTTGVKTFVSAIRKTNGNLRLNAYYVNTTTNTKVGADADDGIAIHDVAIDQVDGSGLVIAAAQLPNDTLKFIAYDVTTGTNGRTIQFLDDYTPNNLPALSNVSNVQIVGIAPMQGSGGKFVTVVRKQNNAMRLDLWQATRNTNNTVSFTSLDFVDGSLPVGEIAMTRNKANEREFVTLHQDSSNIMNIRVWNVDQVNDINLLDSQTQGSAIEGFDVAFSSNRILTARYNTNGVTAIELWDFDPFTTQISGLASGTGPSGTEGLQIFDMNGGNIVVAQEDAIGYMWQYTLTRSGSAITLDAGGAYYMSQAIDGMSGVSDSDGRLFYAIADGGVGELSHELWRHQ